MFEIVLEEKKKLCRITKEILDYLHFQIVPDMCKPILEIKTRGEKERKKERKERQGRNFVYCFLPFIKFFYLKR